MKYYISKTDSAGYTYSIDNIILEYIIKSHIDVIHYLHELNKRHGLDSEYWEKLNTPYCSKYQFYNNHIHLCDGIYIMVGKYVTFNDFTKDRDIYPILKLEINPNKHADKDIFKDLLIFLKENCGDCTLKKYDLCIDLKCKLKDIEVFGSKKEPGLYKGTRYYGQRNKDGYLKIYDKGKEMGFDSDITRIEYTLVYDKGSKSKQGFNFQDVFIKSEEKSDIKINKTMKFMINMINVCRTNNINIDNYIDDLDYRTKKAVQESLSEYKFKKICIEENLINSMLGDIKKVFGVVDRTYTVIDKDGFLKLDNDYDLPFD